VKPPTIEDVRNRVAIARAHGDVAAAAIIDDRPEKALSAVRNATAYWQETGDLLQSYLDGPTTTEEQEHGTG